MKYFPVEENTDRDVDKWLKQSRSQFYCCVCVLFKHQGNMAEGEESMSQEDWKEKCMVLETLLLKFRVQIIKIRELTADKVGLKHLCPIMYCATLFSKSPLGRFGSKANLQKSRRRRRAVMFVWWGHSSCLLPDLPTLLCGLDVDLLPRDAD